MQFAAFWCIELTDCRGVMIICRDRGEHYNFFFKMDKKSITKREMEVRSRTEVKYLQVDLYTGPEVSPGRLLHSS